MRPTVNGFDGSTVKCAHRVGASRPGRVGFFANAVGAVEDVFLNVLINFDYSANESTPLHGTGGWVLLSPYGKFPNAQGLQHFTFEDAQAIEKDFNSLANTAERVIGLPWYVGHPDHPRFSDRHRDTSAKGRIKRVEARHDGLWANVKWSGEGKRIIENEEFHGHSVNWAVRQAPDGTWHPFSLKSVGFTNDPAIPVPPILAANERNAMPPWIRESLGLGPEATDDEVKAKLTSIIANANGYADMKKAHDEIAERIKQMGNIANEKSLAETRVAEAEAKISQAEGRNKVLVEEVGAYKTRVAELTQAVANERTETSKERAKRHKLLLDLATDEGRITDAERTDWEKRFANEKSEDVEEALSKMSARMHTRTISSGRGKVIGTSGQNRILTVQQMVNEKFHSPEIQRLPVEQRYDAAYAAVKKAAPELFAQMHQPAANP